MAPSVAYIREARMKLTIHISISLLVLCFCGPSLQAQADTLVKYSPGFRFTDGIFTSQEQFLNNCPAYAKADLYDEFGNKVQDVSLEYPIYLMKNDTMTLVDSDIVWGYSNRGQVFLRHQDYYNRLVIIGTLCHIIHTDQFVDYDYNYTTYYYNNSMPVRREANVQYIINMETGVKKQLALDTFTEMLEDDPTLYNEFVNIKQKGKRKDRMFLFLRRYNDKHPLFFPHNGCNKAEMGQLME